jgi:hypothetical protein
VTEVGGVGGEETVHVFYGDVTLVTENGMLVPLLFVLVTLCGCRLSFDLHIPPLPRYTDTITHDILTHMVKCGEESCEWVEMSDESDMYKPSPDYVGIVHVQELEKKVGHHLLGRGVVSMEKRHWKHHVNEYFEYVRKTSTSPHQIVLK